MAECAWCTTPVDNYGDTCGPECYTSYLVALRVGNLLSLEDPVPRDLREQPWYHPYIGRGKASDD